MPRGVFPKGNRGLFQKEQTAWNKGSKGSYSTSKKGKTKRDYPKFSNSGVKKGNIPWNKESAKPAICGYCKKEYPNNRKKYCSPECKSKMYPWNKGKEFPQVKGDKNVNWKGGISGENNTIRKSLQYAIWRNEVYERDNWTCRICFVKCKKGMIVAHHINLFSEFPELRFSIDNGLTLCRSCHVKLHKPAKK